MVEFREPDGGWEAYIPLTPEDVRRSKERNRAIWEEACRRLEKRDDATEE